MASVQDERHAVTNIPLDVPLIQEPYDTTILGQETIQPSLRRSMYEPMSMQAIHNTPRGTMKVHTLPQQKGRKPKLQRQYDTSKGAHHSHGISETTMAEEEISSVTYPSALDSNLR